MHPQIKDLKTYSTSKMKSHLRWKDSVIALNAYAPTYSAEGEATEQLHDDLGAMAQSSSKYKITGVFKARFEQRQKKKTS